MNDASGGQELILRNLFSYWETQHSKSKDNRQPADAIRLVACMIKEEICTSVVLMLSGKRTREMQDQSFDPKVALFEELLVIFKSEEFNNIERPIEMDEIDEKNNIDPNSVNVINKERDVKWLLNTWFTYLRPKYKKFLKKWNKETGGGGRTLRDIPNYCIDSSGDYSWLLWVYHLDSKNDFVIANHTNGTVPNWIRRAAGLETTDECTSDLSSTSSSGDLRKNGKPSKAQVLASNLEKSREKLDEVVTMVKELTAEKSNGKDESGNILNLLWENMERIRQVENNTLPSGNKEFLLSVLRKREDDLQKKLAILNNISEE